MIYNGAQKPIVVRPFAAGHIAPLTDVVSIASGEAADMLTLELSGYDLGHPYVIQGAVLVRDWGPLKITPDHVIPSVVLRPGKGGSYKVPFSLNKTMCEGFQVAFLDEIELIHFWYSA